MCSGFTFESFHMNEFSLDGKVLVSLQQKMFSFQQNHPAPKGAEEMEGPIQ